MTVDTTGPRTRRAVLMGALGGVAAAVAAAVARVDPVSATDGDAVTVGDDTLTGTGTTGVTTSGTLALRGTTTAYGATGILGDAAGGAGVSYGVHGTTDSVKGTGVRGDATATSGAVNGVVGQSDSTSGTGVNGYASASTGTTVGVRGSAKSPAGVGVLGVSQANATGLFGFSGGLVPVPDPQPSTGVYGYAAHQDSRAVWGESVAGQGVRGTAASGVALFARVSEKGGKAIDAHGRVFFDSADFGFIASGTRSKTVTPGVSLSLTSKVLVTLMSNPGGTTTVQRVRVDSAADTFTVYLTANAIRNTKFAYFVIG